jgi:hypothetical protein
VHYSICKENGAISEKVKELTSTARLAEELAQVRDTLALNETQKLQVASVLGVAAQGIPLPGTLASIGIGDLGLKASLAGSTALEHAALTTSLVNSLQEIGNSGRLLRDQLHALDMHDATRQIQDLLAGFQVDLNALGIVSPVDRYVDTVRDLQRQFANIVDKSLFNSFNHNLRESIFPSLAALRDGIIGPASGLMIADPLERHGILTWEGTGKRNPSFGSAAFFAASPDLQPLPPSSRKLFIECRIECSICGDPMLVEGEERYWDSPGKLRVSIRIVPLCSACTRRAKESPDYWDEHLAHLIGKARPVLRLIRGKGKGEPVSKRRGHLRLVKPDEQDD